MSLPVKAGVAVLTIGSVSTAGYFGGTYLFGGTPIYELIRKEYEYILLKTDNNEDDTKWDANWESYKQANLNQDKDTFGLNGWVKDGSQKLIDQLKRKCKVLATTKISNRKDTLYSQVTSNCARSVTIADETKELRIVNTKEGDNTDEGIWTNRNRDSSTLQNELGKLGIQMQGIDASKIKKGCRDITTKSKKDNGYKEALEAYRRVCIKKTEEN
ncbi:hypothetical protein A6V39_01300 [Candidatus Mycoplasma haematobovis]|uniref:Uncharacterized protein n=1 Tax=Candidatus Mycoplasma haematobovis TaxID=432608 RepID=A0A1A9QG51_9MOLU|nr:hypothetical protein [Candidatus Mycoplasma haematobovis]OAL10690.1 hypothetical protein A6V39_01300 [Candidatus Mycoplasma haematobovis]